MASFFEQSYNEWTLVLQNNVHVYIFYNYYCQYVPEEGQSKGGNNCNPLLLSTWSKGL